MAEQGEVPVQTQRVLWIAILQVHLGMALLPVLLTSSGTYSEPLFFNMLGLVAVVDLGMGLAFPRFMTGPLYTRRLIGWAINSSASVFGFVIMFMGGTQLLGYGLIAAATVLHLVAFPADEAPGEGRRQS
ncbi:MAG: hypothetical protein ACON5B_15195 [Myxococcota bacterium]